MYLILYLIHFLQNTEQAKGDIKKALEYLNGALKTQTFLVRERISLADIAVACNLLILYKNVSIKALPIPIDGHARKGWLSSILFGWPVKNINEST